MYYSAAQQLAHHASSGRAITAGNLLGSGAISGPEAFERGSAQAKPSMKPGAGLWGHVRLVRPSKFASVKKTRASETSVGREFRTQEASDSAGELRTVEADVSAGEFRNVEVGVSAGELRIVEAGVSAEEFRVHEVGVLLLARVHDGWVCQDGVVCSYLAGADTDFNFENHLKQFVAPEDLIAERQVLGMEEKFISQQVKP